MLRRLLIEMRKPVRRLQSAAAQLFTSLANPSFQTINTTVSNSMSADGLTWSQAPGFLFDQYGNVIVNAQNTIPRNVFIFNNGSSWTDNAGINDLSNIGEIGDRWSLVYDSARDCLHGGFTAGSEGYIYRRYTISRTGNAITSINWTRGSSPNAQLDLNATAYSLPIILQYGNKIVALWSVRTGTGADVRAVMVDITSNADAGATVSNWTHIGFSSTTTIGNAPVTASYSVIQTQSATADMDPSAKILSDGTLLVVYYKGGATNGYYARKCAWNGSGWDSPGTEFKLSDLKVAGTDTGYSLKEQLTSRIIEYNGKTYVIVAVWLSNASGDTVRLCEIDSANTVTTFDVYSAGGAHSYAPTFDITLINTRLIISYLKTSTAGTFARVFNGLSPLSSEVLLTNSVASDIPLLSSQSFGNKLLVLFRKQGSPPQAGYYGTVDYV